MGKIESFSQNFGFSLRSATSSSPPNRPEKEVAPYCEFTFDINNVILYNLQAWSLFWR
jgi:hypothetical protein